jgi:hypothetical protein
LLAAYDLYLKYVTDPKDAERVDVMFHKAALLRRFDHLEQALPIFEQIIAKHPTHETAEWAAQLTLDAYNRLQQYDKMFAFVEKLSRPFLDAHADVAKTVARLRRQGIAKQGGSRGGSEADERLTVRRLRRQVHTGLQPRPPPTTRILAYNAAFARRQIASAAMGVYQRRSCSRSLAARSLAHSATRTRRCVHREAAEARGTRRMAPRRRPFRLSDEVQFRAHR